MLLKEHYDEFLEMIQLFNIDKRTFVLQHRKMFEKGWYDTKIFGAFYCIRTLYRFSLSETMTLIGIWGKLIKLVLIQ